MSARRPVRAVTALVLALVAVVALAGCRVQSGAAAFVGSTRISDSDVSSYLLTDGTKTNLQTGSPRQLVVTILVREKLFQAYLSRKHAAADAATLAAASDAAFQGDTATQVASLRTQSAQAGLKPTFADAFARTVVLEYLAGKAGGVSDSAALVKAVDDGAPAVRLSGRYGTWDAAQLSASGATLPAYLQIATTGATAAAS